MIRDMSERQDKIDALTRRYCNGEISEMVYFVSLNALVPEHEVKYLININQKFHRNSLPYKRGEIS
jgi:hypothetical protein